MGEGEHGLLLIGVHALAFCENYKTSEVYGHPIRREVSRGPKPSGPQTSVPRTTKGKKAKIDPISSDLMAHQIWCFLSLQV